MKHKLFGLILCACALNACSVHKVTQKEQLCAQAQRQNTINQATPEVNASLLVGAKKTQLDDAIQQNCN